MCSSSSGLQFEFWIGQSAHLRKVEAFQLRFGGSALPNQQIDNKGEDEAECEHETHQRGHADQLRHQLTRVTVKQPGHGTVHAVPCAAIVAFAVGKQTQ